MHVLPVTVDMQQKVGGADGEGDLVPLSISQSVREWLRSWLPLKAVVVADFLSHTTAFQLEVTAKVERIWEIFSF